jgi:hypothetical protein
MPDIKKADDLEAGEVRITKADLEDIRARLATASQQAKEANERATRAEDTAAKAQGQAANAAAGYAPAEPKDNRIDDFAGSPGLPFAMYGEFDTSGEPGIVTLNGRVVELTCWRGDTVKGTVPKDLRMGPVRIEINGKRMDVVDAQLR